MSLLKKVTKEMENIFPEEIILRGERFRPEECFNPDRKREIFTAESIALEDLWVEGTHAEGRWFIGGIRNGKLKKWNSTDCEEWVCFSPDYEDGAVETIVARRRNDIDNPVYYFLLEGDLIP